MNAMTTMTLVVDWTTSSSNMPLTSYDESCYDSWPTNPSGMLTVRVLFSASLILVVVGLVGNALSVVVF